MRVIFSPFLIIGKKIVIEAKSVQSLDKAHICQVLSCMRIARSKSCIQIIFNLLISLIKDGSYDRPHTQNEGRNFPADIRTGALLHWFLSSRFIIAAECSQDRIVIGVGSEKINVHNYHQPIVFGR